MEGAHPIMAIEAGTSDRTASSNPEDWKEPLHPSLRRWRGRLQERSQPTHPRVDQALFPSYIRWKGPLLPTEGEVLLSDPIPGDALDSRRTGSSASRVHSAKLTSDTFQWKEKSEVSAVIPSVSPILLGFIIAATPSRVGRLSVNRAFDRFFRKDSS
jgi:hypothetical protein